MRPNKTGWGLVVFFLAGGIFFWITMPEIWIGQIWVAVSVFLGLLYLFISKKANIADALRATGVPGSAQILEMTQTGTYINNQPRVKLKLRVSAPGVPPFEDTRTETVPLIALGQLTTGAPLPVYMPAGKPNDYVIDWSGGGGLAATPSGYGNMTVSSEGGTPTQIAPGSDAGQAVMETLKKYGIDPTSGIVNLRNLPAAREAVLKALREHGVDAAHQVAALAPAIPIQSTGEPVERMAKLKQMHDAGLISAEEFEANKKRILNEL